MLDGIQIFIKFVLLCTLLFYSVSIIVNNYKYIYSYHIKYLKTFIHLFDIRITFKKTYSERFINRIFFYDFTVYKL